MNPDIKRQWVEALRSGQYRQGRKQLLDPEGQYCCLGVLTDLYCKTHMLKTPDYIAGSDCCVLSNKVMEWAGLDDFNPKVMVDNRQISLALCNDGGMGVPPLTNKFGPKIPAMTFQEIADLIERNL